MKSAFALMALVMPVLALAGPVKADALEDYLQIQKLLAQDNFTGVTDAAKLFSKDVKSYPNGKQIQTEADKLVQATDLAQARNAFASVSKLMREWAKKTHPRDTFVAYCPMKEAYWLQKTTKIENPYYGKEMLECGVIEQ